MIVNEKLGKKQSRNSKAHKTVFDIVNHTVSYAGSRKLKNWFLNPLGDLMMITERLYTTDFLGLECNFEHMEQVSSLMKGLPNISQLIVSFQTGRPTVNHWLQIISFMDKTAKIHQTIHKFTGKGKTPILLDAIKNTDIQLIHELSTEIDKTFDVDASKEWGKPLVQKDALDDISDGEFPGWVEIDNVQREIANELRMNLPQMPKEIFGLMFLPEVGFMISLDAEYEDELSWEWMKKFRTDTHIYYVDGFTTYMNQLYYDAFMRVLDHEIEEMYKLQVKVVNLADCLLELGDLFAVLDCYNSFATLSSMNGYVKPEITASNELIIRKGRHPVYEHTTNCYIPNNTELQNGQVTIITGANASGKSVYLCQTGVIVILAHMGCYVPAEYARVGIRDNFLAHISTVESLDKCESTFSIDLHQMSKCLNMATERSLLLIDEFGKGTDVIGGPALLGSLVESIALTEDGPMVLLTTHFHELFEDNVLVDMPQIDHNHMHVVFAQDDSSSRSLTFLYQLEPGAAENSFGIECAKACGIPQSIVDRAHEISREDMANIITFEEDEDTQMLDLDLAKNVVREFLVWDLDEDDGNEACSHEELKQRIIDILPSSDKATINKI